MFSEKETDMAAFISGFYASAGLLTAIGAQNAFVLSNGVKKNHHFKIAVICALFDVLFIMLGVGGIGSFVAGNDMLIKYSAWGGALFLFVYGLKSLISAFKEKSMEMNNETESGLSKLIMATVAVTVLNPHVYLDTIVLLGGISAKFEGDGRYLFGMGASLASIVWFFTLVTFSSMMAELFKKPAVWRALDVFVCVSMWGVAASLVL